MKAMYVIVEYIMSFLLWLFMAIKDKINTIIIMLLGIKILLASIVG